MKEKILFAGLAAVGLTAAARDFEMTLWRGEMATARLYDYASVGESLPGIEVKTGTALRTDYLTHQLGTHYGSVADRVVWGTDAPGVKVVSVNVAADVKPGTYRSGDLVVKVLDRTLPPPSAWKYNLDLWQHPWAVARYFGVEPFSPAHYAKMRPLWEMLAGAGQKTLTVTVTDLPWNHQCYDAYRSMVGRVKKADGTWSFDYRVFDAYVAFGRSCGLGPKIHCYTMCPWDYEVYWLDGQGNRKSVKAVPGTAEFKAFWGDFLVDFARHLKEKGWFEDTYICLDERERGDVENVCSFVREKAPGLKTSLAANRLPSEFKGIEIDDYCSGMRQLTDDYLKEVEQRRAKGLCTTYYVCCGPLKPNSFFSSEAEESFWLGAYPGVIGLDGFLRWAWNSWPQDPYSDGSYTGLGRGWPAGDTFLVYPDGSPSFRFLELRNGIVAAEKLRILAASGAADPKALLKHFDYKVAQEKGYDWRAVRKAVQAVVNGGRK